MAAVNTKLNKTLPSQRPLTWELKKVWYLLRTLKKRRTFFFVLEKTLSLYLEKRPITRRKYHTKTGVVKSFRTFGHTKKHGSYFVRGRGHIDTTASTWTEGRRDPAHLRVSDQPYPKTGYRYAGSR